MRPSRPRHATLCVLYSVSFSWAPSYRRAGCHDIVPWDSWQRLVRRPTAEMRCSVLSDPRVISSSSRGASRKVRRARRREGMFSIFSFSTPTQTQSGWRTGNLDGEQGPSHQPRYLCPCRMRLPRYALPDRRLSSPRRHKQRDRGVVGAQEYSMPHTYTVGCGRVRLTGLQAEPPLRVQVLHQVQAPVALAPRVSSRNACPSVGNTHRNYLGPRPTPSTLPNEDHV